MKATLITNIIFLFIVSSCASVSSIQNAPLHSGSSREFKAEFDKVLRAARESVTDAGLLIEYASDMGDMRWMIIGKKGTSFYSSGEIVRVIVEQMSDHSTRVWVYTKKRVATQVAAKGDYSNSIFSGISLRLH